jgi:putative membrane protein
MKASIIPIPVRASGVLLVGALALGTTACSLPNEPVTTAAAEASEPMSSGEILHVLHVINEGEIQQARLALRKSDNPQVQQTARMLVEDHTASNQRIAAVANASGARMEESPLSRGVQAQASEIRDQLAELSGREFDRAYLQNQVELHEVALDTVRSQLLPNAEDPQVKQLLTAAAPHLEQHLREAEQRHASLTERPRG